MEFAEFMVERKIKILGMDTPSPDKPPFPVHRLLLKTKFSSSKISQTLKRSLMLKSLKL